MNHYLVGLGFLLFILETLLVEAAGYQWVSLKPGDALPANLAWDEEVTFYIGRARYFNEILPAEVTKDGNATISSCHKQESVDEFEVLTIPENCYWKTYNTNNEDYLDIDENIVRGGTARNGEPIFIGTSRGHICAIYLTKQQTYHWERVQPSLFGDNTREYLSCDSKNNWINTSSMKMPNNTVSGGKSEDGYDIYVARLKEDCDIVTGQVIPELGIATAFLNGKAIESAYCQVLVGQPNEYTWVSASDGEIPDYAVVHAKQNTELAYVARMNKTVGHLTHSEALNSKLDYEILVRNQL